MKKLSLIIILTVFSSWKLNAQKNSHAYLDQQGIECVLTWNSKTGASKLYFYKASEKKFNESPYQLPTKPTADEGSYEFYPYLDQQGIECVLAWNSVTGTSKLFYYKSSEKKFVESPYQLPTKPTGDAGTYQFQPYLDQQGVECVLAWNSVTGTSKLFYYKASEKKFVESPYQLSVIE